MEKHIIDECKLILNRECTTIQLELENYIRDLLQCEFDRPVDWPTIFHRVYLHACLKGRRESAKWMETVLFPAMDPIQQIALRQIFPYGRVLLQHAKTH